MPSYTSARARLECAKLRKRLALNTEREIMLPECAAASGGTGRRKQAWYEKRGTRKDRRGARTALPLHLARKVESIGNWELPTTPRCSAHGLKELPFAFDSRGAAKTFAMVKKQKEYNEALVKDREMAKDAVKAAMNALIKIKHHQKQRSDLARRNFCRLVRVVICARRFRVRKGPLRQEEVRLCSQAQQIILYEWPRSLAYFRRSRRALLETEYIFWPIATNKNFFTSQVDQSFFFNAPPGSIPSHSLPKMLIEAWQINQDQVTALLNTKLRKNLDHEFITYLEFRQALQPNASELAALQLHHRSEVERNTIQDRHRREARYSRYKELNKAFATSPRRSRQHMAQMRIVMTLGRSTTQKEVDTMYTNSHEINHGHISLTAPGIRACLHRCFELDHDLGGLSVQKIVDSFRSYCIERIQALWRGYEHALRWKRVRALCSRINFDIVANCFKPWAERGRTRNMLRQLRIRRILKAWRSYTRQTLRHRVLFRSTFWPLYVWHRETLKRRTAKTKAHFLLQVWTELYKIRHFKAWCAYARKKWSRRKQANIHYREHLNYVTTSYIDKWLQYAKRRRNLRRIWFSRPHGGAILIRKLKMGQARRVFTAWNYWIILQRHCRHQAALLFHRIVADDKSRNAIVRSIKSTKEKKKKKQLEKHLASFDKKKTRPLPFPQPEDTLSSIKHKASMISGESNTEEKSLRSTLTQGELIVCRPLMTYFSQELFPLEVAACWMRYWRNGTRALQLLQGYATNEKKMYNAHSKYCKALKMRIWKGWKKVVKDVKIAGRKRSTVLASHSGLAEKFKGKMNGSQSAQDDAKEIALDAKQECEIQAQRVKGYLNEVRELTAKVRAAADADEEDGERFERVLVAKQQRVESELKRKEEELVEAKRCLIEYTEAFTQHAARNLVDTLFNAFESAIIEANKKLARDVFRMMRLPCLERRAVTLMRRRRLRRWLHICAYYRKLDRGMPRFHSLRMKLRVWTLLMKNREDHTAWRSPGLKAALERHRELTLYTTRLLQSRGVRFGKRLPEGEERKRIELHDALCIFRRWCLYTQNKLRWRAMSKVAQRRKRLIVLSICFAAICNKTGILYKKNANKPSLVRRADADLGCFRLLFIAARHCSRDDIISSVQTLVHKRKRHMTCLAREGPSFKKFLATLRSNARSRSDVEKRLLLEAFDSRGRLDANDSQIASIHPMPTRVSSFEQNMNVNMRRDRKCFCDEKQVPYGCRIGAVSVITCNRLGLLGIGITVVGDGDSVTKPVHGNTDGERHIFDLGPEEFLLAVDLRLGPTIVEAIRFQAATIEESIVSRGDNSAFCSAARTRSSRWFGIAPSIDTKRIRLQGPTGSYIVGFQGHELPSRITTLGLIVRSVYEENIFSYSWTEPLQQQSHVEGSSSLQLLHGRKKEYTTNKRSLSDDEKDIHRMMQGSLGQKLVQLSPIESKCIHEFVLLLRYRNIDCNCALERAEAFARRLWSASLIRAQRNLQPLCKFTIIVGLARWLFSALAAPLPQLPLNEAKIENQLSSAKLQTARAKSELDYADTLKQRVFDRQRKHNEMMTENAKLRAARAFQSPAWREAEANRLKIDDRDLAAATAKHALASLRMRDALCNERSARSKFVRINPRDGRVRRSYMRLIRAARHQIQFDQEKLIARSTKITYQAALPSRIFERILESILERRLAMEGKFLIKNSSAVQSPFLHDQDDLKKEYDGNNLSDKKIALHLDGNVLSDGSDTEF